VLDSENGVLVATRDICTFSVPVFCTVIVCAVLVVPTAWLPKDRLVGDTDRVAWPGWPLKATVRGLPAELSVIVSVPVCGSELVGANVTPIVQLPPAAATVEQLF